MWFSRKYICSALAALASTLSACLAPKPSYAPVPLRIAPWSAPLPPTLPAVARVRLSLPRPERVSIRAAGLETLILEARGTLVHTSDGRVSTRIELDPPAEALGWAVGEALYPGRLIAQVAASGELLLFEELEFERYIEGVVASEVVLWSASPAELEAQAIVARTYAARTLATAGELWDTTQDQAYRGAFQPGASRAAMAVAEKLEQAVRKTAGQVLMRNGTLLDARYHAACGGGTAELERVFSEAGQGTPAVACEPCLEQAERELKDQIDPERPLFWRFVASTALLRTIAERYALGQRLLELRPIERDAAGRWLEVELVGDAGVRTLSLPALRRDLGHERLQSGRILRVRAQKGISAEAGLIFEGLGRGHGVGLCQEGAREYARRGKSAAQILAHYYPGAQIERIAGARP